MGQRIALTEAQKMKRESDKLCSGVLERLSERQGARRMRDKDFAPSIGVSAGTWANWRGTKSKPSSIGKAGFEDVLNALYLAGYKVTIEMN